MSKFPGSTLLTALPAPLREHSRKLNWGASLGIFSSTFLTVFLAEMGDKTQITVLLMSAESQSPWLVFLGAGSALIMTSLLGVLVGHWLSHHFPPRLLETAAGALLLLIAIGLLWDVVHL
ncbi:TMEM165/GDT1 family protein [Trichothermofontia sp.]